MDREATVQRYRQLRSILTEQQNAAFTCCLPRTAMLEHARQLGLVAGRTLVFDNEAEMALVADLAVHTARPGRSRAIGRYARTAPFPAGSIEAQVLDALCRAQFSLCRIERRHDIAGLVVADVLRGTEAWLMDLNLTASTPPGVVIACRLCWPAEFAINCGAAVPILPGVVGDIIDRNPAWLRNDDPEALCADPRFAAAIYRASIEAGAMCNVEFAEPLRLAS